MNADDEVLHEQLHYLVEQARKATNVRSATLICSFHDEGKNATASLAVFSHEDQDGSYAQVMGEVIATTVRGLSNLLRNHSPFEVVLRHKETGEEVDVCSSSFGHHEAETKL